MDLDKIKAKLDPVEFDELSHHLAALAEKADKAVNESINGRKALKSENERLKALNTQIMDRLGISEADELDSLPDLKGQAEAARSYEAKVKRLERELQERTESLNKISAQRRADQQAAMLAKAMQSHDWTSPKVVETYLQNSITWEDDTPFFKTDDGKLMALDEGVKLVAQTMPELLKSRGAGGSGYTGGKPGGSQADTPTLNASAIYQARAAVASTA